MNKQKTDIKKGAQLQKIKRVGGEREKGEREGEKRKGSRGAVVGMIRTPGHLDLPLGA